MLHMVQGGGGLWLSSDNLLATRRQGERYRDSWIGMGRCWLCSERMDGIIVYVDRTWSGFALLIIIVKSCNMHDDGHRGPLLLTTILNRPSQ